MDKKILSTNLALPKELSSVYSEVDGLSLQNLFYAKYSIFPNCKLLVQSCKGEEHLFEPEKILDYLLKNVAEDENMEHIVYSTYNMTTKKERIGFCIVLNKSHILARIEKNVSECYILYETGFEDEVDKFIKCLEKFYVEPEREKNNLWKIATSQTGYMLIKSKVKEIEDFDVERQYNDSFAKEDGKIEAFLAEKDKGGLIILHGEKGTDKSTYIRHLINKHDELSFVFVPANLIQMLGEPSFGTFLQTLANHVVILEDC
jgi:predicted acetyltransferase